jgi:hypothetical protein
VLGFVLQVIEKLRYFNIPRLERDNEGGEGIEE